MSKFFNSVSVLFALIAFAVVFAFAGVSCDLLPVAVPINGDQIMGAFSLLCLFGFLSFVFMIFGDMAERSI